ncbi:site-specific integrase [Desulfovibrionales bacterium]
MTEKLTKKKTVARGIRVREHPTRRHGVGFDKLYFVRYKINGVLREEALGWQSEGWNIEKAIEERARITKAHRTGDGLVTLAQRRAAAENEAQQQEAQNMTLHDYFHKEYFPGAKQRKNPTTWGRELSLFSNWIDPLIGHIRIQEIAITQWDFLISAMAEGGLSPRTRQYACMTLRLTLEHAFQRKLIPDMPPRAKLIGATVKPDSNRRTRAVTNEELQAILKELARRDMYAYRITVFCALTCCRFGEAAKLEWIDVDLGSGRATFCDTKNGTSREIPLSETLVDLLKGVGPSKGYVFLNQQGKPYSQAPGAFKQAVDTLGLNEGRSKRDRVVFHTLRHTAATRLGRSGIPLRDLMDVGGWKTPAMALRYQHSGESGHRRAMAALETMTQAEPAKVIDLFGKG